MSNPDSAEHASSDGLERRLRSRQKLRSVAYIDLGPSNGGLVLNLSEAGLAFSSAKRLVGERLPALNFKLPGATDLIEAEARVVWMSESKREAGVQFEGLAEEHARKISQWMAEEHGLHSQLRDAAESAEAPTSVPPPKEHPTDDLRPRQAAKQRVERPIFAASAGNPATSSHWESEQSAAASAASKRRLALSISLFAVIALLAFAAGLKDERRAKSAASQAGPVGSANELTNNAQIASNPPDVPVSKESEVPESKNQPSAANVSVHPTSASQAISTRLAPETGGGNPTNEGLQPDATMASRSSRPDSPQVSLGKTGRPQASRDDSSKGSIEKTEPPGRRPPTAADAKRLQEEAAAERALELASQAKPPPTTPDATNNPANSDDGTVPATPASDRPKPPAGSVEVRVPSSPSMRLPDELTWEASAGRSNVQMGQLILRVQPEYPEEALSQQVQGHVKAHVAINTEGAVESVDATGPPLLVEAATAALRQWRYKPTLLNGRVIPAEEVVVVIFRLSESPPK